MKFNYTTEPLFPAFVWLVEVLEINNDRLKDFAHELKRSSKGVTVSNRGGWHSTEPYNRVPDDLGELLDQMQIGANTEFSKFTGTKKLQIGNFWININGHGDYNLAHDHQNSVLSGVYYISVPEKNMGDLILERHDHSEYFIKQDVNTSPFLSLSQSYTPLESHAYIFPSWIRHRVERNETHQERISMAFNLVYE